MNKRKREQNERIKRRQQRLVADLLRFSAQLPSWMEMITMAFQELARQATIAVDQFVEWARANYLRLLEIDASRREESLDSPLLQPWSKRR